jgi:hypothetical protein
VQKPIEYGIYTVIVEEDYFQRYRGNPEVAAGAVVYYLAREMKDGVTYRVTSVPVPRHNGLMREITVQA